MKAARILPIVVLGTGCAELEQFLPKVKFDTLDVREVNFQRIDTDFVFAVDNPNPVDIELSSFSYDLGLQGVDLFEGDNADGFGLEAVGSSELRLPVDLEWADLFQTVQAVRGEDHLTFDLAGDFGFETPVGEAVIPYEENGIFPAVRTPKFSFKAVRVKKIDLWTQTADVIVDLNVDNEHESTLFFENFDYALRFGGNEVATGLIPLLGDVDGATTGVQKIPIQVDLLEAGDTVVKALTGNGNVKVGLDATTDVDTPFGLLPLALDETGDVQVLDAR